MADARERELERQADAGDAPAAAQLLVERVRAGSLPRVRLELAAYLQYPAATRALELLGKEVEVPADPEDWVLGMIGRGHEANARVVWAAIRPCLPALALWSPEVDWRCIETTVAAWLAEPAAAPLARLVELTEPLAAERTYPGDTEPAGAAASALTQEPVRQALRAVLPASCELPPLPPPAPWNDPGHSSRFPREPTDASTAVFLLRDVLDPTHSDDTAQCAIESVVREYGGRFGSHLVRWARPYVNATSVVHRAVWGAAYRALGETVRAELLPWCLGD